MLEIEGFDGLPIAVHVMGEGRDVVLIHGYFSNAYTNWIRYGHAAKLAEQGFRVIMPDLRGHGESGKPHDVAAYPPDALMRDGFALVERMGLTDYDLGGYSLGARTAVRMVVNGAAPRRLIVAGMGLAGLVDTHGKGGYYRNVLTNPGTFERGTSEWMTEAFLKTTKGDPVALLHILETFVDTAREEVAAIAQPAAVICGSEDQDNGIARDLADALADGRYIEIPGNHMNAVTRKELGQAMADFLSA
ncbi:alpha/beta fold hydrolase [Sphingobium wenxiniae]|uniref:Alpha-beta hydrolase superfamily lysophospholipase n=1 Tax=Sphingobium wenxiniae (strain DSM 21828 / CGMCC 1.7748 / JZ-1) TaxID=595605 RepID=A0A562KQC0_SPHWJ|nr:alpha/beta fold hydrolase [Sphingobium wenxiniae]TWH97475.1 alpha-beta hydrolase superfamily lysophospholipase [Sphingobium wenxiniae]